MYLRSDDVSPGRDGRACSNCDRPTTPETDAGFRGGPAIYSCSTCGQREAVTWRIVPVQVVEEIEVLEEPYMILGHH